MTLSFTPSLSPALTCPWLVAVQVLDSLLVAMARFSLSVLLLASCAVSGMGAHRHALRSRYLQVRPPPALLLPAAALWWSRIFHIFHEGCAAPPLALPSGSLCAPHQPTCLLLC